ncbi:SpoIIE family protein phosphatase [Streptomyces sp. NPDC001443]
MREVATFETDRTGRIVEWGPAAALLLGHEEQEALGRGAAELLAPVEGRAWAGALRQAAEGRAATGVFGVRHRDGHLLEVEAWLVATRGPEGRTGVRALLAESRELPQAHGSFTVLDTFFDQAPIGLAILDTELRFRRVNPVLAAMDGLPEHRHLDRSVAEVVPGLNVEQMGRALRRVLETGEPLLDFRSIGRTGGNPDHDRVWSESYFRLEDAQGRPLGVAAVVIDITAHEQDYLGSAAGRTRLALLNDAITRLGTSLDVRRTAQQLADVAVAGFADLALVDVLQSRLGDGEPGRTADRSGPQVLRRVGLAGDSSSLGDVLVPLGGIVRQPAEAVYQRCLSEGRPYLIPRLDTVVKVPEIQYTQAPQQLFGRGVHSVILVPLLVGGTALGVAAFLRRTSARSFAGEDVTFARDLAARAAAALDNALLFSREQAASLTLQRSLRPRRARDLPGLRIAHAYRPAGDDAHEVGGDWYDVIALPAGKAALVIGDVMGHGIAAAAVMGRLSGATHTLARLDLPPDQVLRHLEAVLDDMDEPMLATCLYAVVDPAAGVCRLSRAGHPPPALLLPDGTTRFVDLPAGAPLGTGGVDFVTTTLPLPPGSLLALYTDGLVETRDRSIDEGLEKLRAELGRHAGLDPVDLCPTLLSAISPAVDDDVTMLVARTTSAPPSGPLRS